MDMKLAIGVHRETWPFSHDLLTIERLLVVVRLIRARGRQALCAVRGHDMMSRRAPGRLWLWCPSCGAETPGWQIDVSPRFRSHRSPAISRRIRPDSEAPERRIPIARPIPSTHDTPASSEFSAPLTISTGQAEARMT